MPSIVQNHNGTSNNSSGYNYWIIIQTIPPVTAMTKTWTPRTFHHDSLGLVVFAVGIIEVLTFAIKKNI